MVRKKGTPEKTEKSEKPKLSATPLEQLTFLDKAGKSVKVSSYIEDKEKDCWFLRNKGLWILNHATIERIAVAAGISLNYIVEESQTIVPTYQNELAYIVRVTIHCNAFSGKTNTTQPCKHSDENILTVTGEANRVNTPHRGRGYLRKMAEKRAFDIAVLKHLGLYSAIYSEDEAEEFKNPEEKKDVGLMPGSKEFESIVEEINLILNAGTKGELKEVGQKIKKFISEAKYTEKQEKYLRDLFKKQVAEMSQEF